MLKKSCILTILFLTLSSLPSEPITIICSTDNPKDSLHVLALEKFGDLVYEYSNGELVTVIHYRGSDKYPAIRSEEINVIMVMNNIKHIHVTIVAVGNVAQRANILTSLTLPYIFPDFDTAKRILGSDYMLSDVNSVLGEKHNMRVLGWLIGGYRHLTNSFREVKKLEDIKGLRIRVPKNRLMLGTYESFGADAVPIEWADTFNALKFNEVHGQENPFNVILTSRFWEANQAYITTNGPFLWVGPIIINEDFFQQLSYNHQSILKRAGMEASQFEWNWITEKNKYFRQTLIDEGMTITDVEDREKWINAGKGIWEEYYDFIGYGDMSDGNEIVNKIVEIGKSKY